jgi:hypothetical protein
MNTVPTVFKGGVSDPTFITYIWLHRQAAGALASLASGYVNIISQVIAAGALPPMVELLTRGSDQVIPACSLNVPCMFPACSLQVP